MSRRADQVLAGFADGDAISHAALALRDAFRRRGFASDIFAVTQHVSPSMRGECRPLEDYRGTAGDLVLHHYSIGSAAIDVFRASPAKRVLVYHNITPAEFFDGLDDRVAASLREARSLLPVVAAECSAVWAVSEFNAAELRAAGIASTRVFPLLFVPPPAVPDDPEVLKRLAAPLSTLLFVGRLAPNKCVEDLLEAFDVYHRDYNPQSRLIVIGSERSCPRYAAMLKMLAGDLSLTNTGFEGFASPAGLQTYYRHAALFVTPSRHEGYCLPLLEAMHHGVPVLARATGGIPEAVNGSGCLYDDLTPAELAGLMHRLIADAPIRADVLASQQRRLDEVRRRDVDAELTALLEGLA